MTPPLDIALVNGRVRTLNPDQPEATAIGIRGDEIVALGDDAGVRAEADGTTEVIDLKGSTAIPGIIDSHVHPFFGGIGGARGADLMDARTLDDVRRLISEERVRQTLRLMDRLPDTRLTPDLAREICQRTSSAAVLEPSIASLGRQYVLALRASECHTGSVLFEQQAQATSRQDKEITEVRYRAVANVRKAEQ